MNYKVHVDKSKRVKKPKKQNKTDLSSSFISQKSVKLLVRAQMLSFRLTVETHSPEEYQ